MDDPAVVHRTNASTRDRNIDDWQYAREWPLPEAKGTDFFFGPGESGSVGSVNDGTLLQREVAAKSGKDDYTIVYGIVSPQGDGDPRNAKPGEDFTPFEEKCLIYTSPPLGKDLVVTGHPLLHLFVSCSADDADFFASVTDVDEKGVSTFVTRHMLRASNRAVAPAPYYFCDLPWHRGYAKDDAPIPPGEIVELSFDLLPTSYRFRAGHRIRVSISCADTAFEPSGAADPAPLVSLWRDDQHRSRLTLPVIA